MRQLSAKATGIVVAGLLALLTVINWIAARHQGIPSVKESASTGPLGSVRSCRDLCIAYATSLVGGDSTLGLGSNLAELLEHNDSLQPSTTIQPVDQLVGGRDGWKRLSVNAVLADLPRLQVPTFLLHNSGHVYVLLDAIEVHGERKLLLRHGHEAPTTFPNSADDISSEFRGALVPADGKVHNETCLNIRGTIVSATPAWRTFGAVDAGSLHSEVITLLNKGPRRVLLSDAITSCSCTAATLPKSRWLEKGQSLAVDVSMQAGQNATFLNRVILEIADDEAPDNPLPVVCELMGCSEGGVRFSKPRVDFGSVLPGGEARRVVELTCDNDGGVANQYEVKIASPWVKCGRPGVVLSGGSRKHYYEFVLTVPAGAPPGPFSMDADFVCSSDSPNNHLTLPLRGIIEPPVDIRPKSISLGNTRAGGTHRATVQLIGSDSIQTHVRIKTLTEGIGAKLNRDGSVAVIDLTINIGAEGPFAEELVLEMELHRRKWDVRVPCVGVILPLSN